MFSSLAKMAIFTTNVDAENQILINHKCVCGALNRHFLVGAVIGWRSCLSRVTIIFMSSVCVICRVLFQSGLCVGCFIFFSVGNFFKTIFLCVGFASSFAGFGFSVGLCDLQMYLTTALAIRLRLLSPLFL